MSSSTHSTPEPQVSILVSAQDHAPDPEKFIAPFFSQISAPNLFEVIFIDCVTHEKFQCVLKKYQSRYPEGPHFHYEVLPGMHRAKANNHAMKIARGKLFIFLGDDFIPPATLVSSHLALHQREPAEEIIGIGNSLIAQRKNTSLYQYMEESGELFGTVFSNTMQSVPPHFFYVGNSSVKRSFIERCGPFDESFPFDCWDDYEIGLRMAQQGMHSLYIPEATTEHDHALSLRERCRAVRRLGYSAFIHEGKFPATQYPWQPRLKRSSLQWAWRFWRYRLRHAISRNPKHLARYLNAIQNSHFVRGYRLAQGGATPDASPLHDI